MVSFKVGVELAVNREAIERILTSPAMYDDMKRRADSIAEGANSGVTKDRDEDDPYLATELVLEEPRAAASVITRTQRGKRDNLRRGTLLKNLDRGR
ncbi:hypothetical protein [Brachybacterium squillarum]|uniref:hypothetical protein n=1 Tax=Brachybacterium squillarum TaxID=661979 RepID=UPI002221C667|nr:hypothetical protein [Brachybacterium squillarum]MCW1803873.1 hypothetical protein [Brachybacterium squillarum]